jgi:hypothetical protein
VIKVKKTSILGPLKSMPSGQDIINFDLAMSEIMFYNYHNHPGIEAREKTKKQLSEGYIINTPAFMYTIINPNSDFINNIDDIDLDKEGEFF